MYKIMDEVSYSPGEVIFTEKSNNDCSLYFIIDGDIEIY